MAYLWILLVVCAELLNALVVLFDKYLVTKKFPHSVVYAFFVGALSSIVLVLIPTGKIFFPSTKITILALLSGVTYIQAIVYLYKALRRVKDPADVVPVVGAAIAISTFIFSFFILKESLPSSFLLSSFFLILGTLLTSHFSFKPKIFFYIFASGLALGLSSVFVKIVLADTTFINGFFWSRIGNVFGALTLFFWPNNLRLIKEGFRQSSSGTKAMVVLGKVLAGVAAVLILYTIKLSSASLVNALVGLQYVFLLLFGFLFGKRFSEFVYSPKYSYEIFHKVISVSFIVAGFMLLFIH
ncbi:MAG: EamA family transporter [Candidatus Pacebacteria bacterium]|nr:EamA family transporter [Candidatus Paceibacterota bacterium]MDD5357009.1 EamA family transporter [Candidatus Paceibacterota bacterium]